MPTPGYVTVLFAVAYEKSGFPENFMLFLEYLAHPSDFGLRELHAEVVIGNTGYSAVGQPPNHCVIKYTFNHANERQPFLEVVRIPVTDMELARDTMERFAATKATYSVPVMDFLTPSIFMRDLDLDPEHWGHLYCSQFVLLYLRKCKELSIIPIRKENLDYLDRCNSRTCSPTHLRHILYKVCKTCKPE